MTPPKVLNLMKTLWSRGLSSIHELLEAFPGGPHAAVVTAAALALLPPVAIGLVYVPQLSAQSKPSAGAPVFEVASVRPSRGAVPGAASKSEAREPQGPEFQVEHDRFTAKSVNLFALIVKAYGLTGCRPLGGFDCVLLSGGPDWLRKDSFDVQAKMPEGSAPYTMLQLQNGRAPQLQLMLQALLADRFQLKIHRETKPLPVFALVAERRGPKLKAAKESEQPMVVFRRSEADPGRPTTPGTVQLVVKNSSLQEVATFLSIFMDRPVIDRTGFPGKYDFTVDYEADADAQGPFAAATGPGMFRAFREQVGVRLEATKGPVEIVVVDRAQRPSGN